MIIYYIQRDETEIYHTCEAIEIENTHTRLAYRAWMICNQVEQIEIYSTEGIMRAAFKCSIKTKTSL